ncbi:hypothetical protein A3G06_02605 [Candidatus Nomurabacteria bacterium RIFCSPLOWO2_12_FULL_46_14]|uniref:Uncharacterized protein n=1 Tax=Candidatus Nomurabacteria bacterium RIFCSPLOWO2_12_FULL_46_14 TaxID=1801797 RepID=A0A1F6Y858_9BACT|nr:MAG: hypothetical protein A3G06_02605 [Candidatus Nomurabacteria bacterium RIFCSPLOWO2_12_FULL_46_14]
MSKINYATKTRDYYKREDRDNWDFDSYYKNDNIMRNRMDSDRDQDNIDRNRNWEDDMDDIDGV